MRRSLRGIGYRYGWQCGYGFRNDWRTQPVDYLRSYYHSPNCNNGTDGEIYVEPQEYTPYTITLTVNGNAVIESGFGLYEGLDPVYTTLLIEDANGCQYEDVITLINPEPCYNLNFSYYG